VQHFRRLKRRTKLPFNILIQVLGEFGILRLGFAGVAQHSA
jgi:hypothetical protein